MRIYISGKITGMPHHEAGKMFAEAESIIRALGHTPVNPLRNGMSPDSAWEDHMVKDISLLLKSDGIFMLEGWEESKGASIEHFVARKAGKPVWYRDQVERDNNAVSEIKEAVQRVTGLSHGDFVTPSQKQDRYFARMLMARQLNMYGMEPKAIARHMNRDRTTVLRMLKMYEDECRYNPGFRQMDREVCQEMERVRLNRMYVGARMLMPGLEKKLKGLGFEEERYFDRDFADFDNIEVVDWRMHIAADCAIVLSEYRVADEPGEYRPMEQSAELVVDEGSVELVFTDTAELLGLIAKLKKMVRRETLPNKNTKEKYHGTKTTPHSAGTGGQEGTAPKD